jgi:L-serine dehydratase
MERISVFDIFKIGIGPSSSHTMGPWRAAQRFLNEIKLDQVESVQVELYGSLAKTGRGHGTDIAVQLGLNGDDPVSIPVDAVTPTIEKIQKTGKIRLAGKKEIDFNPEHHIVFHMDYALPYHANGLTFRAFYHDGTGASHTYYSIGGGFIVKEGDEHLSSEINLPYQIEKAEDLSAFCSKLNKTIPEIVFANELMWRSPEAIRMGLLNIWEVMKLCIFKGCHTTGTLPGGLEVTRRAHPMSSKLLGTRTYHNVDDWMMQISRGGHTFQQILKWVSCFALAVNEENAAGGRVVTAPTNGAAGIVPAVLHYYDRFCPGANASGVRDFLLTAGAIGLLYKENASISGAEVGCQGEVGVACSMAAGGLAAVMGGSPQQVENAAEIGMEHNLGLTCDPVGGRVQIPCIERNAMGSVKALNAARMALRGDGTHFVSLDQVIKTMRDTGRDMMTKYKETSRGGLAVNVIEC